MRKQITKLKKTVADRRKTERHKYNPFAMLNAISIAQSLFIADSGTKVLFDKLLTDLLILTKSKYGFIGEVLYSEKKEPYLKIYAISNIAWNKKTREYYKENAPEGMEFRNLKTLFGRVMTSGKPVISNNPSKDPRRGGLPEGHPPLNVFLGLPLYRYNQLIGMIGIANRPGGYDRQIVSFLKPFLATCSNIIVALRTEHMRRLTEKALWESEENFRSVFENSAVGMVRVGIDGKFLETNPAFERMSGYSRKELGEMTSAAISHQDYIKKENLLIKKLSEAKLDNFKMEKRYIRKDGSIFWGDLNVSVVRDTEGTPKHYIYVIEDITEHRLAEEALYKEKKFSENLIKSSVDGILAFDNECRYTVWNPGMEIITGMKKEDVLGKCAFDVFPFLKETGEDKYFFGTLKGSTLISSDRPFVVPESGQAGFFEGRYSPLLNDKGEVIGGTAIIRDITEHKKLEEQLRHSQKMEALGQLAGGIAHDFNNILTAIISYGYILKTRMDEHDDPLTYCIDAILTSSDRAAILTRGLLSFSRKQIIDTKLLELNNVIKKFEDLLLRVICEDIKLNIRLTDEDLYVMADRIQIELVLMNLITNSCDVMPKGGEITIKTERVELDDEFIDMKGYGKTGEYALISVTDTGSGMDDETMSKIFEPFFTTKESGKGTGLGLSIIFGTMKQHDGYVDVESEVGKGTTFRIYFPLVKAKTEEKEFEEGPLIGGTETILIAEDEESVMFPLKMVLKEFGYEVIEAVDGEDAVNKFMENKDRLQLVIIDVVMPRKSGKDVYEEIKKVSPGIKAIFTSGYTSDIIDAKGTIDKGIDFLSKPVSPDELLRKIRKVLDK